MSFRLRINHKSFRILRQDHYTGINRCLRLRTMRCQCKRKTVSIFPVTVFQLLGHFQISCAFKHCVVFAVRIVSVDKRCLSFRICPYYDQFSILLFNRKGRFQNILGILHVLIFIFRNNLFDLERIGSGFCKGNISELYFSVRIITDLCFVRKFDAICRICRNNAHLKLKLAVP